jgi:hypothetical protein
MSGARRWWLAGAAIVLVVIAAGATPEGFGGFFRAEGPDRVVLPQALRIHQYLFIALAALMLTIYISAQIVARREGIALPRRRSPWRFVAGLILVLLIINLIPVIREQLDAWFAQGDQVEQQQLEPVGPEDGIKPEPSRLLGYVVAGFMALAVLALVGLLWLLLGREPTRRRSPASAEEIRAAIEESLVELETIADPRAAVLACYARLQAAVDIAGIDRHASDAPLELLDRLIEDGRAAPGPARRLTDLFEIARFSPHVIDEEMRRDAITSLEALRRGLVTTG